MAEMAGAVLERWRLHLNLSQGRVSDGIEIGEKGVSGGRSSIVEERDWSEPKIKWSLSCDGVNGDGGIIGIVISPSSGRVHRGVVGGVVDER